MSNTAFITKETISSYRTGTFNETSIEWIRMPLDAQVISNFPRLRDLDIELGPDHGHNHNHGDLDILARFQNIRRLTIRSDCDLGPISKLGNLSSLRLSCTSRVSSIPPCPKLRHLQILGPGLDINVDACIEDICRLKNLRSLRFLTGCSRPFPLRPIAESLSKLARLHVDYITDCVPMPNIRALGLRVDPLALASHNVLECFTNLKALGVDVGGEDIDAFITDLDWLAPLTMLERIEVRGSCRIDDISVIGSLPTLKSIYFGCVGIPPLSSIQTMPRNLRSIEISASFPSNIIGLEHCANLRRFSVDGFSNNLNGPMTFSLEPLIACRRLKTLRIQGAPVNIGQPLVNWPELEDLEAQTHDTIIFPPDLPNLSSVCLIGANLRGLDKLTAPRLTKLIASGCDIGSVDLGASPNLYYLNVSGSGVTELQGLSACPKLEIMYARDCPLVNIDELSSTVLRELCVDNSSIRSIPFGQIPNIEVISAPGNRIESIAGIEACQKLRTLNLADNLIADPRPLRSLPVLRTANLKGNPLGILDIETARVIGELED